MCVVKTPKIKDDGSSKKPLPILRNPFLDGLAGSIQSIRLGRSSLRIDRIFDGATGGGGSSGGGGGSSGGFSSTPGSLSGGYTGGGGSSSGTRSNSDPRTKLV